MPFIEFRHRACTRPFAVGLEYSQLYKRAYNLVACEYGGFENALRAVGICAIPI